MGGDPALRFGSDRVSLGLSREPETLADRRLINSQRPDAPLAGKLLCAPGRTSGQHRARLWAPGSRTTSCPPGPHAIRKQSYGRDLQDRPARIHRWLHRRQQPPRHAGYRAIFALAPFARTCELDVRIIFDRAVQRPPVSRQENQRSVRVLRDGAAILVAEALQTVRLFADNPTRSFVRSGFEPN